MTVYPKSYIEKRGHLQLLSVLYRVEDASEITLTCLRILKYFYNILFILIFSLVCDGEVCGYMNSSADTIQVLRNVLVGYKENDAVLKRSVYSIGSIVFNEGELEVELDDACIEEWGCVIKDMFGILRRCVEGYGDEGKDTRHLIVLVWDL